MAEDISVHVNRVKKALEVVHAQTSPQNDRHEAYLFLEKIQTEDSARLPIAFALMEKSEASEFRHYGLTLLEKELASLQRTHSNYASKAQQLIQIAENLLHNGIKPIDQEKEYIKKKIVKVVDCLAQRFWPVHWMSLKTLLFQTETPEQVEMNILCLQSLHWTASDFTLGLSQVRQKELYDTLVSFQDETLQLLNTVLDTQKESANAETGASRYLLKAAIACTASFVRVASLKTILSTKLLVTIVELTPENVFFKPCISVLLAFLRRTAKYLKPPLSHTVRQVWKKIHVVTACIMEDGNLSREDYLNPLLDILSQLVLKHSGVLTKKGGKEIQNELLQILMKGCSEAHPFTVQLILSLWHELLSRTQIKDEGIIPALFPYCFQKLRKDWYHQGFFDDKKRMTQFANKLRGTVDKLIRTLFMRDAAKCLEETYKIVLQVKSHRETDAAKIDSMGWVKYESFIQCEWMALRSLISILFIPLKDACVDMNNPAVVMAFKKIMDEVLSLETEDSLILTRWYHILSLPLSFYSRQPKYAEHICIKILRDLQKEVTFQANLEDYEMVHNNFVAMRRRGCYTLLKLAKELGKVCLQFWGDIFAECEKIMSKNVHKAVAGYILEFLVATSNACDDPKKRLQFLVQALESPMSFWCEDPIMKKICENPLAFAEYFDVHDSIIEGKEVLDKIRTTLNIFNGVLATFKLHHSQSEDFYKLFQPILQRTLLLVRAMNMLWTKEFKEALNDSLIPILENNLALMYTHYGHEYDPTESATKRPKEFRPAERLFNWIYCVYEQTCILLGLATRFGPAICSKYDPQVFIDHCFFNAEQIPLHHFRWLCSKFFAKFGKNCHESHYERLFKPILLKGLRCAFSKLDGGWTSYNMAMKNPDHLSEVQLKREILQETQLRESSKKFAESLQELFISPSDKGSTNKRDTRKRPPDPRKNPSKQDKLLMVVIRDSQACELLFQGLCATFTWNDSLVHRRICYLGRKMALLAVDKESNRVDIPSIFPYLSYLMFASLNACMNMTDTDTPTESAVSDFVQSVCTTVGRHNEAPLKILRNIPDVEQKDLMHLLGILENGNDKRCRTSTRKFIERYVVGKSNENFLRGSRKTIEGLGSLFTPSSGAAAQQIDFTLCGFDKIFND